MKAILFSFGLFGAISCSDYVQDLPASPCSFSEPLISDYAKAGALQAALDELVSKGVPGAALAVYSAEGAWATAAGYSKIETKTRMELCQLQYLQSVAKTYMAVAILKLYEQGRIDLSAPIERYLPSHFRPYLPDVANVTIAMLLSHTSGIPEYNSQPAYVSKLLAHPNYRFTSEEYLGFIKGKPADFAPGSRYAYRNTNYLVLALIADAITGDHAAFISKEIFEQLGLQYTFYRPNVEHTQLHELVNGYWDRHSDGIVENVSQMQLTNVASLIGDDGIVATPLDAVKFLKGLMDGKLLSARTLQLMKTWVNDAQGSPTYGLGLDYTTLGGQIAFGHSGGGLGAGCQLYYFPGQNVFVFIGINLGTVTESPIHDLAASPLDKIYEIILK